MIIRAATFDRWLNANFTRDQLADIASHGADCGYAGLSYNADLKALYSKFDEEIYEIVYDYAVDACGYESVPAYLAEGKRGTETAAALTAALVWAAAEILADRKSNRDDN